MVLEKVSKVGFLWILTISFVILKAIGAINWPWLLVLSPVWAAIIVAAAFWYWLRKLGCERVEGLFCQKEEHDSEDKDE